MRALFLLLSGCAMLTPSPRDESPKHWVAPEPWRPVPFIAESASHAERLPTEDPLELARSFAAAKTDMLAVYTPEDQIGRKWAAVLAPNRKVDLPCHGALLESASGHTILQVEKPAGHILPGTVVLVWKKLQAPGQVLAVTPAGQWFEVAEAYLQPRLATTQVTPVAPTCWIPDTLDSIRIWARLESPLYEALEAAQEADSACRDAITKPIWARAEKMESQIVNRGGHLVRKHTDEEVTAVREVGWAKVRKGCVKTQVALHKAATEFLTYWEGYVAEQLAGISTQLATAGKIEGSASSSPTTLSTPSSPSTTRR